MAKWEIGEAPRWGGRKVFVKESRAREGREEGAQMFPAAGGLENFVSSILAFRAAASAAVGRRRWNCQL